jgi:hypothetical protein
MKPFAVKGLGDAYLRLPNPPTFRWLMRHQGVADIRKIAELDAYLVLLRRTDSDPCLLEMMRGSRPAAGSMDEAEWLRGCGGGQRTDLVHQREHVAILRDLDDATVVDPD